MKNSFLAVLLGLLVSDVVKAQIPSLIEIEETAVFKSAKPKAKTKKRARNDDGTLKGDDPSTPDVNEAWEDG